jgi:hypothetical protein
MNSEPENIEYTGSGVLPFSYDLEGNVVLLLHSTFKGKKAGTLVDFGGSIESNDQDLLFSAVREFCEETSGLFTELRDEILQDFENQINISELDIQNSSLIVHSVNKFYNKVSKSEVEYTINNTYRMYFIKIDFTELDKINRFYSTQTEKRREFRWVSLEEVISNSGNIILHPRVSNSRNFFGILSNMKNNKN